MEEKLLMWQKKFLVRISKLSDKDLLGETLEMASGDDYDGGFTERGYWEYEQLRKALDKRLPKSFRGGII